MLGLFYTSISAAQAATARWTTLIGFHPDASCPIIKAPIRYSGSPIPCQNRSKWVPWPFLDGWKKISRKPLKIESNGRFNIDWLQKMFFSFLNGGVIFVEVSC